MRDLILDFSNFQNSLETIVDSNLKRLRVQDRSTAVVTGPNFQLEKTYFFNFRVLNLKEFCFLGIVSWYLPDELSFLLRLDLEEYSKKFSFEDRILCEQFLKSKINMILFLKETNLWHSREFFGNLLNNFNLLDKILKVKTIRLKKPVYPIRKRGYNDKGSSVLPHKRLGLGTSIVYSKEFRELEEKRKEYQDTLSLIEGMLW